MSELHPRLAADTGALCETNAFWCRWMNDQRFPWVIVVPKAPDVGEWHELDPAAQQHLLTLVNSVSETLQRVTGAEKMNIGALGNVVPQLHVHVIARHAQDPCWPGPVWGQGHVIPYLPEDQPAWLDALREVISEA